MDEQGIDAEEAVRRLTAKLSNPRSVYNSSQVVFLMSTAGRWGRDVGDEEGISYRAGFDAGYRARVAEENAAYPPEPVFSAGQWMERVDRRRQHDIEARLPREGDLTGNDQAGAGK